jgi:ribosomal-protein-alanine N-acetyltransferase
MTSFGRGDRVTLREFGGKGVPVETRRAETHDLAEVLAIQQVSPEASQWDAVGYAEHELLVAVNGARVIGFLAWRPITDGERELLNLAVAPDSRRKGAGRALVTAFLGAATGKVFLEVRESNDTARKFYKSLGFQEVMVRKKYYNSPDESAIVMLFHSC